MSGYFNCHPRGNSATRCLWRTGRCGSIEHWSAEYQGLGLRVVRYAVHFRSHWKMRRGGNKEAHTQRREKTLLKKKIGNFGVRPRKTPSTRWTLHPLALYPLLEGARAFSTVLSKTRGRQALTVVQDVLRGLTCAQRPHRLALRLLATLLLERLHGGARRQGTLRLTPRFVAGGMAAAIRMEETAMLCTLGTTSWGPKCRGCPGRGCQGGGSSTLPSSVCRTALLFQGPAMPAAMMPLNTTRL